MSAKLLKALARGHCTIRNASRSEVLVYWKGDRNIMHHQVIRSGEERDMLKQATVDQLRKSPNLKELFNRRLLRIVSPDELKRRAERAALLP